MPGRAANGQTCVSLFNFVPAVVARVAPFGVFIAFIALDGLLSSLAHRVGMDPRWWYAIRSAVVAGLLLWFWRSYEELNAPARRVPMRDWLLSVVVGALVIVLWVNLDVWPLSLGGGGGYDPRDAAGTIDWRLALTRAAGASLVVPVMEELFWRSCIMR